MTISTITGISIIVASVCYLGYKKFFQKKVHKISFKEALDLTDLPIITFHCGDKKLNFLLDTGSNNCHINKSIIDNKEIPFNLYGEASCVYGMEGNIVLVENVTLTLNLQDKALTGVFSVTDLEQAFGNVKRESGVTLHGILGTNFFNAYRYIIDFDKYIAYSKK